jgi:hypothetical protein
MTRRKYLVCGECRKVAQHCYKRTKQSFILSHFIVFFKAVPIILYMSFQEITGMVNGGLTTVL